MARKKRDLVFHGLAMVSTLTSVLLGLASAFSPDWLGSNTGRMLGQIELSSSGEIRPNYVSSQITLFLFVCLVLIVLVGFGLAGTHRWISASTARAVAADRPTNPWLLGSYLVFVVICLLLGLFLPKALFRPTNEAELGRQLFLAAWSLRSWLGGLVLGLALLVGTVVAAWVIYLSCVIFPRSVTSKRYQRIMENG